jgi:serine/threonine protein phosphatase PrpC
VTEPVRPIGFFAGASARGSAHVRDGRPNQDAFGSLAIGRWIILAVADGHGAQPHFRSDRGARFAVDAACAELAAFSADGARTSDDIDSLRAAVPDLPRKILQRWRRLVGVDAQTDSIVRRDQSQAFADEPSLAYGATCIAVALAPGLCLALQIGDGDLIMAGAGEELVKPLADDEGLLGPQTFSLCQPDAAARFRWALFGAPNPLAEPDFILLSTDGLSKSFSGASAFREVGLWLRSLREKFAQGDAETLLGGWAEEVARRGAGDDVTLMAFLRESATK